jgi:hypothetical protein
MKIQNLKNFESVKFFGPENSLRIFQESKIFELHFSEGEKKR